MRARTLIMFAGCCSMLAACNDGGRTAPPPPANANDASLDGEDADRVGDVRGSDDTVSSETGIVGHDGGGSETGVENPANDGSGDCRRRRPAAGDGPIDLDPGVAIPDLGEGDAFVTDSALATRLANFTIPFGDAQDAETSALAMDVDWDGDRDLLVTGHLSDRQSRLLSETVLFTNRGENGWSPAGSVPSPETSTGPIERCIAAGDIVGDAAWDLICTKPQLVAIEGELRDGRQGLRWTRVHVIDNANIAVDYSTRAEAAEVKQVLLIDLDRDGLRDVVVSTFAIGEREQIYWQRSPGLWERDDTVHTGLTFSATPWLFPDRDRWGVHFSTESDYHETDNYNSVAVYDGFNGLQELYSEPRPEDPCGFLGPLEADATAEKGTPMGSVWWYPRPGQEPLLFLAQDNEYTPIFQFDRTLEWVDVARRVPGFLLDDSEPIPPRVRWLWSAAGLSLRGLPTQDLVSVTTSPPQSGLPNRPPPEGVGAIHVWLNLGDRLREVGYQLGFERGGYTSLQTTDIDGDGAADLVVGGANALPAVWFNRLEQHGNTLNLEVLGLGHDGIIEIRYGDTVHRQILPNQANPWIVGGPEAFFGVGDATEVEGTVMRPGQADQTVTVEAPGRWLVAPDMDPIRQ